MADIPGQLGRGNWTAALFVDDKASIYAVKALTRIFTGRAGGSTGLLKILVGSFLGVRQEPIVYETQGETRIIKIEKIIDGVVKPIAARTRATSSSATANTGSRRTSSSRAPTNRASGCSAATGISKAVRPKSASSTGAIRSSGDASCTRAERYNAALRAWHFQSIS